MQDMFKVANLSPPTMSMFLAKFGGLTLLGSGRSNMPRGKYICSRPSAIVTHIWEHAGRGEGNKIKLKLPV